MRAVLFLALVLIGSSDLFAQCPGGNCNAWRQVRYYQQPYVYQQPVYYPPQQVVQQPAPQAAPLGVSLPNPLMRVRPQPQLQQPLQVSYRPAPQPQRPVTARVYNSGSYNHNGSGIPLDAHLAQTHGINATGMSAAQQEAEHLRAHAAQARGYGYSSGGRPRLFGRLFR